MSMLQLNYYSRHFYIVGLSRKECVYDPSSSVIEMIVHFEDTQTNTSVQTQ